MENLRDWVPLACLRGCRRRRVDSATVGKHAMDCIIILVLVVLGFENGRDGLGLGLQIRRACEPHGTAFNFKSTSASVRHQPHMYL